VDEVDGRSPVERAAATFVPEPRRHCARAENKSTVEFFAAVGSFKIKHPNRDFHRKNFDFKLTMEALWMGDAQIARCVRRIFLSGLNQQKKLDSKLQSCNLRASNSLAQKIQPE